MGTPYMNLLTHVFTNEKEQIIEIICSERNDTILFFCTRTNCLTIVRVHFLSPAFLSSFKMINTWWLMMLTLHTNHIYVTLLSEVQFFYIIEP